MTPQELTALLPFMVLGGGILVLTLVIAFLRNHTVSAIAAGLVLLATGAALAPSLYAPPTQVTPLFMLDAFGAFIGALVLLAAFCTVVFSHRYLRGRRGNPEEFYLLLAIASLGGMVTAAASHFAGLLLGLEIVSISLYAMIAYPEEGHAPLEAGLKYLVLSGVGSTTLLFGMALIYHATGSMQFEATPEAVTLANQAHYITAGNLLIFAGLAFKLSLVPFHMWTPDVYQGAPAPVAGFIATVSKSAVVAVLFRLVIGTGALADDVIVGAVVLIAIVSMIAGNLLALQQTDLKRLLAYSSIAHLGYLMIAVVAIEAAAGPALALESGLVYLAAYVVMTLAGFGAVALLSSTAQETDAGDLQHYRGLFWAHPWLAGALTVVFLALAGIPLTIGFIGKFYLFTTAADGGLWNLLWALIVGSAFGIYYYLRVIYTMTLDVAADESGNRVADAALPRLGLWVCCALAATILVAGIYPAPLIELVGACIAGLGT